MEQLSPSLSQPLANSLASFFCQKIVALKESISSKLHSGPSPFDFDQPHAADLLSDFAPVTPAEVARLLQSMSNKSSQLDYIPTSLLKSCADTFSLLISHLANLSFSQATFPTDFKLALISPLLKKPGLSKSDSSVRLSELGQRRPKLINWGWTNILEIIFKFHENLFST